MSPEAEARILRVVEEMWRAASAPSARSTRDQSGRARMVAYAKGMLETTVEAEVARRIGERDGA